jgi:hypothetical protein
MTIETIYNLKEISFRSYKICLDNGLKNIGLILDFYNKNKTFTNIRNCGIGSNMELIALCLKYNDQNYKISNFDFDTKYIVINKISILNDTQLEIIKNYIDINLNNLSNRSRNVLGTYLGGNFDLSNIKNKILDDENFSFKRLRNSGIKTITELEVFIDKLIDYVQKFDENDLIEKQFEIKKSIEINFIEKTFSISKIPKEIIEANSIFSIMEYLININAIFNNNENIIFKKTFRIYNNQLAYSLDNIVYEINMSIGKIRQIRNRILFKLSNQFLFLQSIKDDIFNKYKINLFQDIIFIDNELNDNINKLNKTNFSKDFTTLIIYSHLSLEFDLIGNLEILLYPKHFNSRSEHNWNNLYICRKQQIIYFDINCFVNDINNRLKDKIEETYSFNFKSYLQNFIKIYDNSTLIQILPIAEKIINEEFDIFIDVNDNITFRKNTLKTINEYVIDILDQLGKPTQINEIYNLVIKEHPDITKSPEALRGSIQRSSEFIFFGKSSTYGLKKWEIEKEGIKGGTIKDIVLEYLNKNDDPIHIIEILNEVHKYREKTNTKNIITNLKLDPQNQFLFFNQNFVGLRNKTYNSNLTKLPKFMGKSIMKFIRNGNINSREYIECLVSNEYKISNENASFIIDYLIENKYIFNINQNELTT